jgi:aspartate aminotransferase
MAAAGSYLGNLEEQLRASIEPGHDTMFLTKVPVAPPDAIFDLVSRFKADTHETKLNLSVGAYRDGEGKPWVLPVVVKAEKLIQDDIESGASNHEYLPIGGLPAMVTNSTIFALGADHPAIKEGRADGIQTLSGTGALRTAGEFVRDFSTTKTIYISEPTWGNHKAIFKACGLDAKPYSYYKPETRGLDFEGYCAAIKGMEKGATAVLHGCAHNPTGVDPTLDQWKALCELCKERELLVVFDTAYQGFASGDPAVDAAGIRHFADEGVPMMICQSYSKNFGLYNERAGCLLIVGATPEVSKAVVSQLKILVRRNWSNPPAHGALIVSRVLGTPELYEEWLGCLKTMSGRIIDMRKGLFDKLVELKTPGTWHHIIDQIGMFSFTGLTKEQVAFVIEKYHIYMLANGRINMCGVTVPTIDYLATAIHDAVTSVAKL